MNKKTASSKSPTYYFTTFFASIFIIISCKPLGVISTSETKDAEPVQTTALPALPTIYQSSYLNPLDTPHTYVDDTCRYLRNKWNLANAEPGTVVIVIMVKEIYNGLQNDINGINIGEFARSMQELKLQGFEAITMKEFLFFIERNVKIPPRSVLIIQDGNYDEEYFYKYFHDYWDIWGWPVISGWTSDPDMLESKWEESVALEHEGWVDHQAQGVIPDTILSDDTSKAVITRELEGSLTAFADRFGKTPYAYVWPSGGFGLRPVTAARQLGYQLGFTANSRGPVMYNWVPLADEIDPARPSYIPEGPINDPLMTLPRYSPDQILDSIDAVRIIGKEAAAYAQANKAAELEYYEAVCRSTYGPMPSP